MKTHSQVSTIALITFLTMALAMMIALICITNLNSKSEPVENPNSFPDLTPLPTDTPTDTETVTDQLEEHPSTPELEAPKTDLRFTSNGDGTCVLSGLGDYTDSCVVIPQFSPLGDRVTAIAPMAFYRSEAITAIQLPSTIMTIGALAFADCPNLVYISVSKDNPYFCDIDGILYTADEATLLVYPAKRSGSEVAISAATVRIADMAFYRCAHLSLVRYSGTAEQWEKIRIGTKNYSLTAAAKEFSDMNQAV